MSVSHFFVWICLAWSANLCSVTGKIPYFTSYFLHSLSILSFCGLTPYPTFNYNLAYCLCPLHSPFYLIRCLMMNCWARIRHLMHAGRHTFTASIPVPITPLFLIPWFDISLYLRLRFMVSTNQFFYRDTISRKTATQGWRVLSTHETDYPPPDADLVF